MTEKELKVLELLYTEKLLPRSGYFNITEDLLFNYVVTYGDLYGNGTIVDFGEYKFARRLAGRTFLALLFSRGFKYTDTESGILYMIANPAFADYYKIGMTINLDKRLAQYQTYSPLRDFKVVRYAFVLDRSWAERALINHSDIFREEGEWVKKDNVDNIFLKIIDLGLRKKFEAFQHR